ncbi:MAG: hypothetical protein R3F10_10885 [Lysobacteraceae bacterium]
MPANPPTSLAPAPEPVRIAFEAAPGAQPDSRYLPLDLRAAITVPLNGAWPLHRATGGDFPTLAPGPQRFNGVDFRVEGGVQLPSGRAALHFHSEIRISAAVPVPDATARRLHLLALRHTPMNPDSPPHRFARVLLTGTDGHDTALEVLSVRDLANHQGAPRAASAHLAWVAANATSVASGEASDYLYSSVYHIVLDVPPNVGPIRALRFESPEGTIEAPMFYAATLEP